MNFPTIPVEDVQYNIAAEITKSDDEEQKRMDAFLQTLKAKKKG